MVYLEWIIKIRIVSFSEWKLAEEMFYWYKFWGILESIEKAKNMIYKNHLSISIFYVCQHKACHDWKDYE